MPGTNGGRPLRVGLVGTGFWARTVHHPTLAAMDGVELVGLHGRDPERRAAVAAELGIPAVERFEALLERADVIDFAVPPAVQATLAPMAARAGRHLVLEKPLALTVSEGAALVAAIREADVAAVVFMTPLYNEDARDLIARAAPAAGGTADAMFRSGRLLPGSPYLGTGWRHETFGALWDVGPHLLAILLPVLGPVAGVQGTLAGPSAYRFRMDHAGGGTSTVEIDLRDPTIEFFVERYRFDHGDASVEGGPFKQDRPRGIREAVGDLRAAIADRGAPVRGDLDLAFRMLCVIDAAQRSMEAGGARVTVRETADV